MRIVLARWSLGNGLRRLGHSGFPLPRESLRLGDLGWGHPLGERITSLSGSGFSMCGREVVPHVGLDKVLEHPPPPLADARSSFAVASSSACIFIDGSTVGATSAHAELRRNRIERMRAMMNPGGLGRSRLIAQSPSVRTVGVSQNARAIPRI